MPLSFEQAYRIVQEFIDNKAEIIHTYQVVYLFLILIMEEARFNYS